MAPTWAGPGLFLFTMITAEHACGFKVLDTAPDIEVHRRRFPI